MAWADDFINDLAKKYNVTAESSDVAKLGDYKAGADKFTAAQGDPNYDWTSPDAQKGISTPDQLNTFESDLDKQYKQRGASNAPATGAAAPSGSSTAQSWLGSTTSGDNSSLFPSWYQDVMQRQIAQQQAQQADLTTKSNDLYSRLSGIAGQSTDVSAADPVIKGQVDAYRSEQTRAQRDYVSDAAERLGPYGNVQGEARMAAEKAGQNTSSFQAQIMANELTQRREQIAQALQESGSLLSADQQRNLTAQLSQLDQAIKETQTGVQANLGAGNLALGNATLNANVGLTTRGQNFQNDQFLRSLGLTDWQAQMYWDAVNSGRLG